MRKLCYLAHDGRSKDMWSSELVLILAFGSGVELTSTRKDRVWSKLEIVSLIA